MALATKTKKLPPTYFALVKRFPLIHIRDDSHLDAASAMIDELLQQELERGRRNIWTPSLIWLRSTRTNTS